MRNLPSLIHTHYRRFPKTIGLELDILPTKDCFRYQDLFPGVKFVDGSTLIRDTRKIKSPFEVDLMKVAGQIGKKVYQRGHVGSTCIKGWPDPSSRIP